MSQETPLSTRQKAAALALSEVQKALRFYRLYPREHPFVAKSLGEAHHRVSQFFGQHEGDLEVEVERDGLRVDEVQILESSDQSTDLAYLLHPEGVEGLTLRQGLPQGELDTFLGLLAAQYVEEQEITFANDLLTALWKEELEHIDYRLRDDLAGSSLLRAPDPVLEQLAEAVADLGSILRQRRAAGVAQADELLRSVGADDAHQAADPTRVEAFLASPAGGARRALAEEVGRDLRELGDRAADVVVWSARQREHAPDEDHVARYLAACAIHGLASGDLDRAAAVLRRIQDLADTGDVTEMALSRLSTRPYLGALARALEHQPELSPEDMIGEGLRFLGPLPDAVLRLVGRLYPTFQHDDVRRVFRRFLSSRVDAAVETLEQLSRHEDEAIVKEAVGMLALAEDGSPGREVLARLAAEAAGPRARWAKEAIDVVSGERDRRRMLEVVRAGSDKRKRLAAFRRLERGGVQSFDELCELVRTKAFAARDDDEIIAAFDLLSKIGDLRAVRVFTELAERKKTLLGGKDIERVRGLAEAWMRKLRETRGGVKRPRRGGATA